MRVKRIRWIAAAAIVVLGAWAMLVAPAGSFQRRGASPWGDASGDRTAPTAPPGPGGRVVRPEFHVIEKPSPIVGSDRRLTASLGIEADGRFMTILPVGSPIPAVRLLTIGTDTPEQEEIRLHLLRGAADPVTGNRSLGWVKISGLRPFQGDQARATIVFAVQNDEIVLAAMDPVSKMALPVEATGPWGQP